MENLNLKTGHEENNDQDKGWKRILMFNPSDPSTADNINNLIKKKEEEGYEVKFTPTHDGKEFLEIKKIKKD